MSPTPRHPSDQFPRDRGTVFWLSLGLALLLPLGLGALLSWHSLGELDVWLHQAVGRQILAGEGFPRTNQFSFTAPDRPWTNHEWLFQVVIAALGCGPQDDPAGAISRWNLLRLAATLLLLGLLLAGDRPWRAPPTVLLTLAPALLLGVLLLWPRLLVRPELISYLFFIGLVRLAERPEAADGCRPLIRSPLLLAGLLTLVWAQLHGFSSLAPVLWLLGGALAFVPGGGLSRPHVGRWLLGALALLLVQLLTPNGWAGLVYPLKALGQFSAQDVDLRQTISELVPLQRAAGSLHLTILAFQASVVWAVGLLIVSRGRGHHLRWLLWGLSLVATLAAQRNIGFYALSFLLLNTGILGNTARGGARPTARWPILHYCAYLGLAGSLIMAGWLGVQITGDGFYLREGVSRRFGSGATEARYPLSCLPALNRQPATPLFCNVDAAALAIDRSAARVFIDGRTEAYPPELWRQYLQFKEGGPEAVARLDQEGVQGVLLATAGRAFLPLAQALLQTPEWTLTHGDAAGLLWLREPADTGPQDGPKLRSLVNRLLADSSLPRSPVRQADRLAALATLAELTEDDALTEQILRRGLAARPDHPGLNHNLGNRYLARGDHAGALPYFHRALEMNPRLDRTALNIGVCLLVQNQVQMAIPYFQRAVALDPDNTRYRINLGLALQRDGRRRDALAELEKALAADPGNQRLRNLVQELRRGS